MYSLCADSSSSFEMKIGSIIPARYTLVPKYRVQFSTKNLLILMNISSLHIWVCVCAWNLYVWYMKVASYFMVNYICLPLTCSFYSQVLINLNPRYFDDEFNESLIFDDDFKRKLEQNFSVYKNSHVHHRRRGWVSYSCLDYKICKLIQFK